MTTRRIPTGIFITKAENYALIQFYGQATEFNTPENVRLHQQVMAALGEKHGFNWKESEVTPEGEVIHVVYEGENR